MEPLGQWVQPQRTSQCVVAVHMSLIAATYRGQYVPRYHDAGKYLGTAWNQNQNQIYSLEQYTVIPTATYSFVPPGCRRGGVSGRVSAAARVRPARAGLSLGRLALVTPTCLLVVTSLLSIYR